MRKGLVLAGGHATRLQPCTLTINKHLLPVWNKPMIYYPIQTLKEMGITDILITLGANSVGDIVNLLKDGSELGVNLTYKYQKEAGGIAQAIGLAEDFANGEEIAVILGDNIFLETPKLGKAPHIYLTETIDPERFGVVEFGNDWEIIDIIEKPKDPPTNLIVTGLYIYPPDVFNVIKTLKPSNRGELEVTDVNRYYIKYDKMNYTVIEHTWHDAGTFSSLNKVNNLIKEQNAKSSK